MSDDIRVPRTTIEEWIRRADSFGMVDLPYDMRALLAAPPAAQPTGELEFLGYVNANAIPRIGEGLYAMVWESADQASKYHDNFVPDGEAVKVYLKRPALDTQTAQPELEFRNSDGSTDVVDLSPAMRDSKIRDRLIELGWKAPE